jgi:CRISPR/Cas system-associated endonuclease Cas3-HD
MKQFQDIIFKFHYNRKIVHYQILENIIGLGPMVKVACYIQSLGKELGLYKDPYQYFGMLEMKCTELCD